MLGDKLVVRSYTYGIEQNDIRGFKGGDFQE